MNLASSKRQWPLGRGFERYYGFLGGETNQWYPDLVYDNHPVPQPALPEDGYHLTVDLTDKAIEFIQDQRRSRRTSRSSSTTVPARPTHRITRRRSGPTSTGAASTWDTRRTGRACSSGRRPWASCPRALSCRRSTRTRRRRATTARPGPRSTGSGRGTRCPTRSSGCSPGWRRCTPVSSATPTTSWAGCWTTWRAPASSTTPSSCSSPTTAPRARAARMARSTRTSSSTVSPTRSRRT